MNLKNKKQMIARTLNVGKKRIKLEPSKLEEIKKAITKTDIRSLLASGAIKIDNIVGQSRYRTNKLKRQKSKGQGKGVGSKKGRKFSRLGAKKRWILRMRTQRGFIKALKDRDKVSKSTYRDLYSMIKSNRFRNVRLIKLYLEENKLFLKDGIQKKDTK
ncbi:MAG: 50S ribosomal protein L19e [Nanoarchaeota archaeon]